MAGDDNRPISDTAQRIMTALFILPLLVIVWGGSWPLVGIALVMGGIMLMETLTISGVRLISPRGIALSVLVVAPTLLMLAGFVDTIVFLVVAASGLAMLSRSLVMALVIVFLMLTIHGTAVLALDEGGISWMLMIALVVTAADSMAFFVGRRIGGPKLAPSISPSKTWSGAIGGLLGGALAGGIAGAVFGAPVLFMALFGLIIADLSIGGDLLESFFKRAHGVKDSGKILPGHGGILDRCDGYLLAVPAAHLALVMGWLHG